MKRIPAMEQNKFPRYKFRRTVYAKFLNHPEFTMAKYRDISISGFSCYSFKHIKKGTVLKVEVNLKMISGGIIDDTKPHIASAVSMGSIIEGERKVLLFKFIDYSEGCFDNLKKTIEILEKQNSLEKTDITDSLKQIHEHSRESKSRGQIVDDIKKISEELKEGKIELPVLPKVVNEVQRVIHTPDRSIDLLSDVIKKDAVISARLIAISNSPFFGGMEKSSTVKMAITRIGIEETYNQVLAIANKSIYNTKNLQLKSLLEKVWIHSLACGYTAKSIAEKIQDANAEQFFAMGIVHDIGKTILLKVFSESVSKKEALDIDEISESIQAFHSGISGVILRHWKMTKELIRAAAMHEGGKFAKGTDRSILIINVANHLAQQIGYGLSEEMVDLSELQAAKLLQIDLEALQEIGEKVKEIMMESDLT